MKPPASLVNGETILAERILGHGVIAVRSIGYRGEIPETTVGIIRPGVIAHGTVRTIKMIVNVAPKWIENETMNREGGPLVRIVRLTAGPGQLAIIAKMTIIRSVNVEEWKRDSALFAFQPRSVYRVA